MRNIGHVKAVGTSTISVLIEQVLLHRDGRGGVFEPFAPEHIPGQRNVQVVVTEPGCVRGNHDYRGHDRGMSQGSLQVEASERPIGDGAATGLW